MSPTSGGTWPARGTDRGSAVADFAMVAGLVSLLFLAACQLGFALHVHNTATAHAIEGARHGARADATPAQGAERTRELLRASLADRYAEHVSAQRTVVGGVAVVEVRVEAPLPLVGPWGPAETVQVSGRAFAEAQG